MGSRLRCSVWLYRSVEGVDEGDCKDLLIQGTESIGVSLEDPHSYRPASEMRPPREIVRQYSVESLAAHKETAQGEKHHHRSMPQTRRKIENFYRHARLCELGKSDERVCAHVLADDEQGCKPTQEVQCSKQLGESAGPGILFAAGLLISPPPQERLPCTRAKRAYLSPGRPMSA